jgi:MGT family glycosyltransferase
MAHFAILTPEHPGHLLPIGTVGTELVRRGHRVTILADAKATPLADQLSLPLQALDFDDVPNRSQYLLWRTFRAAGCSWMIAMREGFERHAEAMLQKVPRALNDLAIDGVLIDQNVVAGGSAALRAGLPFVTLSSALLWHEESRLPPPFTSWNYAPGLPARLRNRLGYAAWHWYMRPTMKLINCYRKTWRLPPLRRVDDVFSPLAQISQLCPEFDFPRRELPAHFHYIGSFAASRKVATNHDFPWDRLGHKPLIFASLGTIPDPANPPMFRKILAACAGLDAQLVLALGHWQGDKRSVRDQLGSIPEDAIVVNFAPQMELLDRASLLITHAGSNTVVEALTRGVPMVALPRSADQLGMGSRVAHGGSGMRLSFHRCTPVELRRAIERVLTEKIFRDRAEWLQKAMRVAGGAARAADIVEQALTARQPILRCTN